MEVKQVKQSSLKHQPTRVPSKHSTTASLSKKRKETMSKTEQKMALVAKRLSMLHDSTDSVSEEAPMQYESNKRAKVVCDDESEEDGEMQCLIQPMKKERTTAQKRDANYDAWNHENHNGASDNSRNPKLVHKLEEKFSTCMDSARKIQENLSVANPSFVKMMLPSHVSGGFWLNISSKFCHDNLPKENCIVILVDEAGREFKTNYLVHKSGLSGGWRAFSIHHVLQKGDVLVFHLIDPTTFKVNIVREQRLDEVDGALGLLELDTCARQMISDTIQKAFHTEDTPPLIDSPSPSNTDIDSQPEVLDGIRFSNTDTDFKTIPCFDAFKIIVDGLVIDSKFSHANKKKYYELCRSQNSFLHQHLLRGLNCNLVVGIILETVNISDAIRACTSSTSLEDLRVWKTTLDGFNLLGMKLSFLCTKLSLLLGIANESKMIEKCTLERAGARKRMRALEDKIMELKTVMEKIDSDIEAEMTAIIQKHETMIKEVANTPW